MKYYCKNCNSKVETDESQMPVVTDHWVVCPLCSDSMIEEIPDYESPEQYEKRMGKAYPDNGVVWFRIWDVNRFLLWDYADFSTAKEATDDSIDQIVIADPPVPPSDDWGME